MQRIRLLLAEPQCPCSASLPTSRRDLPLLPPDTKKVWDYLKDQPALSGFVLIGGSALALQIHHRISEDLDLAYPELVLPRARLDVLLRLAEASGFQFQRLDNESALLEFLNAGMELHDYQQNFLVNAAVKVSFFTPDAPLCRLLSKTAEAGVRVATLAELFKSKSLVSAQRSKTRDWLDLYVLLREHGFSMRDYQAAFQEAGAEALLDISLSRLSSGLPQKDDEGYAHLLSNPPTLAQITKFFQVERDRYEVETALRLKLNLGRGDQS